ncbi:MAG: hypothetical protein ACI4LA_08610 [Emergencia sp.]
MSYLKMTERDVELQKHLLQSYRSAARKLPKGRLLCRNVRGAYRYYRKDENTGKEIYLRKSEQDLIEKLKLRRSLEKAIENMETNLKYQQKILDHYRAYDSASVEKQLPASYSDDRFRQYEKQFITDARDRDCGQNDYLSEGRNQKTSFGLMVRSKSEVMIAEILHSYGIPFRYEEKLTVRSRDGSMKTYLPDFTIYLPWGKLYWEHFGLFSRKDYREKSIEKLNDYFFNGIVMPSNLIVTMDGPAGEFDIEAVERIVRGFLLPCFR